MPMAPLVLNRTSGDWMWTAASVLSLRTPKLEFDPALGKDFDGSEEGASSGLSMLERYVIKLLDASFSDSSLFWHYAMRHVPSPSLMCAKDYSSTNYKASGTRVAFVNDADLPSEVWQKVPSNSVPMHGYGAFPLGGASSACFCGWNRVTVAGVAWCEIPSAICRHPSVSYHTTNAQCRYRGTEARQVISKILDAWPSSAPQAAARNSSAAWSCPELDLSDAWGIMPDRDADAWIESNRSVSGTPSFRISELVRAGRAGLRIGNALDLKQKAQGEAMWPTERVHKLAPDDDEKSTGVSLSRCSDTIMSSINAASVAKEIVDDLFPVAQGIHESAPMSFCLRFAIEYSRMRMLKAVRNLVRAASSSSVGGNAGGIEDEVRKQKSVLDSWKGKCESQLNMLAACKGVGAFSMIPEVEFPYQCPFVITTPYNKGAGGYYVTPTSGCLLYYNGAFYNPCRHTTKPCGTSSSGVKVSYTLDEITGLAQRSNTLIKFDVRSTGTDEILGSWPIKFYDKDPLKNEVAAQVVESILRWQATSSSSTSEEDMEFETENDASTAAQNRSANIPWRLSREFIEEIFMNGGSSSRAKGSVGNTKPAASARGWATAEGLVTDGAAAEFCDGIADWWPDVSSSLLLCGRHFIQNRNKLQATECPFYRIGLSL